MDGGPYLVRIIEWRESDAERGIAIKLEKSLNQKRFTGYEWFGINETTLQHL